ncbi:MAG: hypothetical protein AB8B69_10470, partial [Chitinophagales bacterium]
ISSYYPLQEDGSFEFIATVCSELEGEITLIDLENISYSTIQTVDLSEVSIDIGELIACEEIESFIQIEVEDYGIYFYENPIAVFNPIWGEELENMSLSAYDPLFLEDAIWIKIPNVYASTVGQYENITGSWRGYDSATFTRYELSKSKTIATISKSGVNVGDKIEGTIAGKVLVNQSGTTTEKSFNATFKAIRQ